MDLVAAMHDSFQYFLLNNNCFSVARRKLNRYVAFSIRQPHVQVFEYPLVVEVCSHVLAQVQHLLSLAFEWAQA